MHGQSSNPGIVKAYFDPSIRAATAGTYPPFLNSGFEKAVLRAS